jgi:hypothetical protein
MPYIPQDFRTEELVKTIKQLSILIQTSKARESMGGAYSPGVLNYTISMIVNELLKLNLPNPSYAHINKVIGVLECVKLELYRRVAGPYEDEMIEKNGDIYPND